MTRSPPEFRSRYGPWAVISGASEGTGRSFALRLASGGVNCVLIARRPEPLARLADEIRSRYGVDVLTLSIDLAQEDACARIAEGVGDREVGLYVANAGADPNGARFLDRPVDVWLDLVRRNVSTTMRCCHQFGSAMRNRGRGGLLLVGSGACYGGLPSIATYCGTKAFEMCFAEGLWAELRPHGVDVLYFSLSQTDTPEYRRLLASKGMPVPDHLADPDQVAEMGLARLPHGPIRNWGQEDDVAGYAPNSPDARRARIEAIAQSAALASGPSQVGRG